MQCAAVKKVLGAIKVPVHHPSGPDPKSTTIRPTFGCPSSGCPLVIACAGPTAASEAARTAATSRTGRRSAPVIGRVILLPPCCAAGWIWPPAASVCRQLEVSPVGHSVDHGLAPGDGYGDQGPSLGCWIAFGARPQVNPGGAGLAPAGAQGLTRLEPRREKGLVGGVGAHGRVGEVLVKRLAQDVGEERGGGVRQDAGAGRAVVHVP